MYPFNQLEGTKFVLSLLTSRSCLMLNFTWLPSWLDRGALINVDAPGCGTSVVRGPTGHK